MSDTNFTRAYTADFCMASRSHSAVGSFPRLGTRLTRRFPIQVAITIGIAAAIFSTSATARDGDLDRKFGTQGTSAVDFGTQSSALGFAIAPDGKVVLAGSINGGAATGFDFAVARLTRDGLPDTSFSFDGKTTIAVGPGAVTDSAQAVIAQADGKIVVVGDGPDTVDPNDNYDFQLVRLNVDGTLDPTFSGDGKASVAFDLGDGNDDFVSAGVQQANGKLVIVGSVKVAGEGTDFGVVRLNVDGSRDTSFQGDGRYTFNFNLGPTLKAEIAKSVAIDAAGNILIAGIAQSGSPFGFDFAIARLTPNGILDPNFGGDGRVNYGFNMGAGSDALLEQLIVGADGSIFATGSVRSSGGDSDFAALKLLPDGTPDASYGSNGRAIIPFDLAGGNDDYSYGSALQTDGKLIVSGYVETLSPNASIAMARLGTDGQLDPSFGFAGKRVIALDQVAASFRSRIQGGYLVFGGLASDPFLGYTNMLAGRVIIDTVFDASFE